MIYIGLVVLLGSSYFRSLLRRAYNTLSSVFFSFPFRSKGSKSNSPVDAHLKKARPPEPNPVFQLHNGITKVSQEMIPDRVKGAIVSLNIPESVTDIEERAFVGCSRLESIVVPLSFIDKNSDYWRSLGIRDTCIVKCSDTLYNDIKAGTDSDSDIIAKFTTKADGSLSSADALIYLKSYFVKRASRYTEFVDILLKKVMVGERETFMQAMFALRGFHIFTQAKYFQLKGDITEVRQGMIDAHRDMISSLDIPDSVRLVGENAFYKCVKLESIGLPKKLETIGKCAFMQCTALKSMTFPDELMEISNMAFSTCSELKSIKLPKKLETIGDNAFSYCSALNEIKFTDALTKIGAASFQNCYSLKSIKLPKNLQTIGASAFMDCSELEFIELPEGLETIGENAFKGCTKLKKIVVPLSFIDKDAGYWRSLGIPTSIVKCNDTLYNFINDSTNSSQAKRDELLAKETLSSADARIYFKAFVDNNDNALSFAKLLLDKIQDAFEKQKFISAVCDTNDLTLRSRNSSLPDRLSFFKLVPGITEVTEAMIPGECEKDENGNVKNGFRTSVKRLRIPEGVKFIKQNSFQGFAGLGKVELPSTLEEIDTCAFQYCSSLNNITLPPKLKKIGHNAFHECMKLQSIKWPPSLETIGNQAFHACYSLTSINLPKGLKTIGKQAFYACHSLRSINLPKGLKTIDENAFRNCTALQSIKFPDSLKKIGEMAFYNCGALGSIKFPDGLQEIEIGPSAFYRCSKLNTVTLPSGLKIIGQGAFGSCYALKSINLPKGLRTIGKYAFESCTALESITLPEGLEEIGNGAFIDCYRLKKVIMPKGLKKIGFDVFANCSKLQTISLPDGFEKIGKEAFVGCSRLESIVVPLSFIDKNSDYWRSLGIRDTCIVKCSDTLYNDIKAGTDSDSDIIAKFTTKADGPLSSADAGIYLKAFLATRSMSYLPDFAECLLAKVRADEKQAFINNICGMAVVPVEMRAAFFRLIPGITEVTGEMIPEDIRAHLQSLDIPASVVSISESTFMNCTALESITFPKGLKTIGENAFLGCSALQSIELLDGLNEIGKYAFLGCIELKSITFPKGLKTIGRLAFRNCTALESISLPKGLKTIGFGVFANCSKLQTISLPDGFEEIGLGAFKDCSALEEIVVPVSFMDKDESFWRSRGIAPEKVRITCSDSLYNNLLDVSNYTTERLCTELSTDSSSLSYDDASVLLKYFIVYRGMENVSEFAQLLLDRIDDPIEKQKFINYFCEKNNIDDVTRSEFFQIPEGITKIMIPSSIKRYLQTLVCPDSLKEIGHNAFQGCRNLNAITLPSKIRITDIDSNAFSHCLLTLQVLYVPLSFMRENSNIHQRLIIPPNVDVQCVDELYNAIEPDCDIDEIITTKKAGDGFTDETIGIYLNHAVSKRFGNQKLIKLARSMVAGGDTSMLKEHLLFLYKNNRIDLLKDYEREFGEKNVRSLLSSAVGETTKKLNKMVESVPFDTAHKYLYINPEIETEKDSCNVNVLLPFAGGGYGIVTDNTCKSTVEMQGALKHGMLVREIEGYIRKIDNFISELERLDGEGVALILQLKKIKGECYRFLNEYNTRGEPLYQLKEQLLRGLTFSDQNTESSFPEPLNQHLRGNNNLYGAVFSVVDRDKGGTYLVDNFFRTTTPQTDPNGQPTAVCSFSRETYRSHGHRVSSGTVSPFATAVAEKMRSAPQVQRKNLIDEVIRGVDEVMLQIGDDKLDDAKVAENVRLLIEEKKQKSAAKFLEKDSLEQALVKLNADAPPPANHIMVRYLTQYSLQNEIRSYITLPSGSAEKQAIIGKLKKAIERKANTVNETINVMEKEMHEIADKFVNNPDESISQTPEQVYENLTSIIRALKDKDICVQLKDTELMQKVQGQLRRQEAVKRVFSNRFPEEAKAKDWEDVFKDEYVDLDDTRNILYYLVTDWDEFAKLHGETLAPFYDTIEKTDKELGLKNANQLALFSQIAIARVNVMARSKDLSTENFGVILDGNKELRDKFCIVLAEVMKESRDVEDVILKFINDHYATFGMTRQLDQEESAYCAKQIKFQINTIWRESPHMDEFFFLGDKVSKPEEGKAPETVVYGGLISMPFVGLLRENQRNASHNAQLASFRKLKMDGSTLNVSQSLTFTKMLDAHPKLKSVVLKRKISQIITSDDKPFKSEFLKMAYFSPEKTYKIIDTVNTLSAEQKQKFLSNFIGPGLPLVIDLFLKREEEKKAANTLQRVYRGSSSRRRILTQLKQHVSDVAARPRGSSASLSGNDSPVAGKQHTGPKKNT